VNGKKVFDGILYVVFRSFFSHFFNNISINHSLSLKDGCIAFQCRL